MDIITDFESVVPSSNLGGGTMNEIVWRSREEVNDALIGALAGSGLNDRYTRERIYQVADAIYDDDWCGKHKLENRREVGKRALFSPASQALIVREMVFEFGKDGVGEEEKKMWESKARVLLGI